MGAESGRRAARRSGATSIASTVASMGAPSSSIGSAVASISTSRAPSGSSSSGALSGRSGSSSSAGRMRSGASPNSSMPNTGSAARGREGSSATRLCWWTSFSSRSAMSARPGCTRSTRLRIATALATKPSRANSSASPSRTGTASSIRPACINRSASWSRTATGGARRPWSCRRNVSMALPRFLCAISSPMSASRGVLSQSRGIGISGQAPRLGYRCTHPRGRRWSAGRKGYVPRRSGSKPYLT